MKKFNVRIYGIVINANNELLVAHEVRNEFQMTKLPGGGLEWGEGLVDGLKREFIEELNWDVEVHDLFYITDYFQVSSFNDNDQVLSIYYMVSFLKNRTTPHVPNEGEFIEFQWIPIHELVVENFTFPIDRIVINKLKKEFSRN